MNSKMNSDFEASFGKSSIVAILRGISPHEVPEVAKILLDAGVRFIEVPLNSPEALKSVSLLRLIVGDHGMVGAGTVLSTEQVAKVASAGGQFIVSPNMSAAVISATKRLGLISLPGVSTVTEAFAALDAGADALKVFPVAQIGTVAIRAWRSVLPPSVKLIAVGGVSLQNLVDWREAGCDGVGLGQAIYFPEINIKDVDKNIKEFQKRWRNEEY